MLVISEEIAVLVNLLDLGEQVRDNTVKELQVILQKLGNVDVSNRSQTNELLVHCRILTLQVSRSRYH